MTPTLDITGDVCPMTFVKVKMGLAKIGPSETLDVLVKEEALKNVISSLKAEGHTVVKVVSRDDIFLLVIKKGAPGNKNKG